MIGTGGVGMNAVQGAQLAGARYVVAIDPVEFKREQAQQFGASHAVATVEEAQALLGELTWGRNAEKVIVTVGEGKGADVGSYISMVAKGGKLVFTSVADMDANDVTLNLFELLMMEKSIVGTIFGSANPRYDIPASSGSTAAGSSSSTSSSPAPTRSTRSTTGTRTCATARTSEASSSTRTEDRHDRTRSDRRDL